MDAYLVAMYEQGSQSLRHYSMICSQIRALAIAQGLVVLGASSYLFKDNLYKYSMIVVAFGLLLTAVLWLMHENYYKHFHVILEPLIKLETKMNENTNLMGIWAKYYESKIKSRGKGTRILLLHYGVFSLLIISLIFLLIVNCIYFAY